MAITIQIPAKNNASRLGRVFLGLSELFPTWGAEIYEVICSSKNGITIEIDGLEFEHTGSQQRYFHKWAREFGKFTGNTEGEIKDIVLGEMFGTELVDTKFGPRVRPLKRSSEAKRIDYSALIDTLILMAAEMGFQIPPPTRRIDND